MRVNLNLNKYYDGLDLEHVNGIFSRMLDLKPIIDKLDFVYNEWEERFEQTTSWKIAKKMNESNLRVRVRDIDKYMAEIKREGIFGTVEGKDLTEEDYKQFIDRYKFLMSEPEKDKESDEKEVKSDSKEREEI